MNHSKKVSYINALARDLDRASFEGHDLTAAACAVRLALSHILMAGVRLIHVLHGHWQSFHISIEQRLLEHHERATRASLRRLAALHRTRVYGTGDEH